MPTKESVPTFTVIDGGKTGLDRKKWLLFNQPWALSLEEFDQVAKLCGLRRAEEFDLMSSVCATGRATTSRPATSSPCSKVERRKPSAWASSWNGAMPWGYGSSRKGPNREVQAPLMTTTGTLAHSHRAGAAPF